MSAANRIAKWPRLLRSSSAFVFANLLAGVCHYLFQVFASKELSAADFSQLNAWFANLALFFVIGGVLQYAANFFPVRAARLRRSTVFINIYCLAMVAAWFYCGPGLNFSRALIVLSGASLFSWLLGQVQSRMLYLLMTAANLLIGGVKLAFILIPYAGVTPLERYAFALFACYLPALWFISIRMWKSAEPTRSHVGPIWEWGFWTAPFLLSLAGAVIPQFDLVLMDRIQLADDFQLFARASLFYKGIYFLMFLFAQWLLPRQIRKDADSSMTSLWLGVAGLAASALLALISPLVVSGLLKWNEAPPQLLIFTSCLNMSLLTWIFLLIQEACAHRHTRVAGLALLGLALEAVVQLQLHLPTLGYMLLAIFTQMGLVGFLTRFKNP